MTLTYILNTEPLNNRELFEEKLSLVDDTRKNKVLRLPPSSQRTSLGAGLLIREFVGEITTYNKQGKPLSNTTQFNISHSGKFVVLSVSSAPVGVDIEVMQRNRNEIAKRFFANDEYRQIEESENQDETFTKIWTLKEAFLKCIGTGIGEYMRNFAIFLGEEITVSQKITDKSYYFKEYPVEGYKLSVCSEDCSFGENLIDVTEKILGKE